MLTYMEEQTSVNKNIHQLAFVYTWSNTTFSSILKHKKTYMENINLMTVGEGRKDPIKKRFAFSWVMMVCLLLSVLINIILIILLTTKLSHNIHLVNPTITTPTDVENHLASLQLPKLYPTRRFLRKRSVDGIVKSTIKMELEEHLDTGEISASEALLKNRPDRNRTVLQILLQENQPSIEKRKSNEIQPIPYLRERLSACILATNLGRSLRCDTSILREIYSNYLNVSAKDASVLDFEKYFNVHQYRGEHQVLKTVLESLNDSKSGVIGYSDIRDLELVRYSQLTYKKIFRRYIHPSFPTHGWGIIRDRITTQNDVLTFEFSHLIPCCYLAGDTIKNTAEIKSYCVMNVFGLPIFIHTLWAAKNSLLKLTRDRTFVWPNEGNQDLCRAIPGRLMDCAKLAEYGYFQENRRCINPDSLTDPTVLWFTMVTGGALA